MLALLWGTCASLGAQEGTLALEIGGARVQQLESPNRPATIGTLRARLGAERWFVGADATGTIADSVGARQFIGLAGVQPTRWARTETAFSATRVEYQDQGIGFTQSATLRQHLLWGTRGGAWVQGDLATTERLRSSFRSDAISGAAWWQVGPAQLWSGWQRAWSTDGPLLFGPQALRIAPARPIRYDDLSGGVLLHAGRVDLAVAARRRTGVPPILPDDEPTRTGADARVTVQLTAALAVDVSHGVALADPLRGAPEARVTSLLLRLQRTGRARAVSWHAVDGGADVLVRVRGSDPVEITGSFADWEPRAMTRDGRGYVIRLRLSSGTHRLAIRRAGGAWRAPDGLPRVADEFGGESGLLVIP
ncbi:MAG: hypothetical protein MUE41_07395 [Gemmatimonadaceae bacterium]|nr:hypothetical protein [Gemmatimonadaceae bacterium]